MAEVRFIVVGTQRTGTTLIRTCLDSHPQIRCIGETFKISWSRGSYEGSRGYLAYQRASLSRRLRHFTGRSRLIYDYLDEFYSQPGISAAGFKFMYNQIGPFRAVVPYVLQRGVRVIHVVRENVLKTYVSRLTARKRGHYHAKAAVPLTRVEVPVEDLIERLDYISSQQIGWSELFEHRVPYLRVAYERFVGGREQESRRLLDFLGQDYVELSSPLRKVNPDSFAEFVQNYDEVRACLAGTSYAACLH